MSALVITPALLVAARASPAGAALYGPPLAASCAKRGIGSTMQVVDLLANVLNESGALTSVSEDLTYSSAAWLHEVFASHFPTVASAAPYVRNPQALGAKVYGSYDQRGLGLAQLTWASGHAAYAADIGMAAAGVAAYLQTPAGAADSAVWFFVHMGCGADADAGDLTGVRRKWAGTPAGRTPFGLAQVEVWQRQVLAALGHAAPAAPAKPGAKPGAKPVAKQAPKSAPKPAASTGSADGADDLNQAELDTLKGSS